MSQSHSEDIFLENDQIQAAVWTSQLIFALITAVEEKEIIWNVARSEYKNRDAREMAWNAVAKKIKVKKQEANDKWRLLRQQFRNALKKNNQGKSGIASASKKPSNDYFSVMMFLQPMMSMQSEYRKSNMDTPTPSPPTNSSLESISDNTMNSTNCEQWPSDVDVSSNASSPDPAWTSSASKRSRKSNEDDLYRTAVTKAMQIVDATDESSEFIWARYIASMMINHLNKNPVRQFKFRVNRLAEQLEMGELDNSTLQTQMPMQTQTPIQSEQQSNYHDSSSQYINM